MDGRHGGCCGGSTGGCCDWGSVESLIVGREATVGWQDNVEFSFSYDHCYKGWQSNIIILEKLCIWIFIFIFFGWSW
jgi:uncharacterized protein (DUF779 family)